MSDWDSIYRGERCRTALRCHGEHNAERRWEQGKGKAQAIKNSAESPVFKVRSCLRNQPPTGQGSESIVPNSFFELFLAPYMAGGWNGRKPLLDKAQVIVGALQQGQERGVKKGAQNRS